MQGPSKAPTPTVDYSLNFRFPVYLFPEPSRLSTIQLQALSSYINAHVNAFETTQVPNNSRHDIQPE